jgi:DNA-binding NarL/FixJ family response regulator
MDKNTSLRGLGRPRAANLPPDRLVQLLSSFSHLRKSNRALMDMLRESIHELRELRTNLRSHQRELGVTAAFSRNEMGLAERYGLTRREAQVARLLARGRSNQAIARDLNISAHTARHHTQRILAKLEVHSRGEAGAKIRA